ncbi:MAG: protein TolQ [Coxiellaceae bacterium]|jgi:biopolymer transport protein TolQ|nr:protein TolQ [Coxiellaceae bacterium]
MTHEPSSLWSFVANAGPVVKIVMLLLLAASVWSWTIIFQRFFFLKDAELAIKKFEKQFWSGSDLNKLYTELDNRQEELHGLEHIFYAGFGEYSRLKKQATAKSDAILEGVQRAMRIAFAREAALLELHLSFLATVGSTSPYVGLFGTVWGIMTSFRALGRAQQATMAMVAPGISEALIATAMGLSAAIPAVIAYNRYASEVEKLANLYDTFREEFSSILHRQVI